MARRYSNCPTFANIYKYEGSSERAGLLDANGAI